MKKFLYLLLIPLCMGFAACGGDDDNDGGGKVSSVLNGTWTYLYDIFTLGYHITEQHILVFNNGSVKYMHGTSVYTKLEGNYTLVEETHLIKIKWQKEFNSMDGEKWELVGENDGTPDWETTCNYTLSGAGTILKISGCTGLAGDENLDAEYNKEITI